MSVYFSPVGNGFQWLNQVGQVLSGGKINTYAAGTTTPVATYTDNTGLTPNANPIILDSTGRYAQEIWLSAGQAYKFVVTDSLGVTQFTLDNLYGLGDPAFIGSIRNLHWASDYGVLPTNTGATNYANLTTAFAAAAGGLLRIPAGTYAISFSGTTGFVMPANLVIEGDGKGVTILNITMSSLSFPIAFSMGLNGLMFRDITINIVQTATQVPSLILWNGNGLILQNCDLNGGMTNTGATLNSSPSLIISPSTGTQTDCQILGCDIHQWNYGFLKSNAQTSVQSRIKVLGNNFFNNYTGDCSINSPKGACNQIVIAHNTFHDANGQGASVYQYAIALASCTDAVIHSNVILGTFGNGPSAYSGVGAIHIEENCQTVVIADNTIDLNGTNSAAMVILDNNQGTGTYFSPNGVTITGNNMLMSGTQAGTMGLWTQVVNQPSQNIAISGNTIRGFAIGFYDGNQIVQDVLVANNVIDSCIYGIWTVDGGLRFTGNETSGCTNGVYGATGNGSIVVKDHIFNNCTNNVISQSQTRAFVLMNPKFIFPLQNPGAASNTYLVMGQATAAGSDRIHGYLAYTMWCPTAAADMVGSEDEVTWTGSVFTTTNKVSYSPGAVSLAPLVGGGAPANKFVLNMFSTSARTNVRVEASLNGIMVQNT